jgi:hypothetical protein
MPAVEIALLDYIDISNMQPLSLDTRVLEEFCTFIDVNEEVYEWCI